MSKPNGILGIPSTITVHKKESTQLHPDITTALVTTGQKIPTPPKNGIGKDPRKAYEDAHWTEDEKEGHRAYVESVQNKPAKSESDGGSARRVSRVSELLDRKRTNGISQDKSFRTIRTRPKNISSLIE